MPPISGWKKEGVDRWVTTAPSKRSVARHRGEVSISYHDGEGFPYHTGWYVFYKARSGLFRRQRFDTRKQAREFAMDYMRRNQ